MAHADQKSRSAPPKRGAKPIDPLAFRNSAFRALNSDKVDRAGAAHFIQLAVAELRLPEPELALGRSLSATFDASTTLAHRHLAVDLLVPLSALKHASAAAADEDAAAPAAAEGDQGERDADPSLAVPVSLRVYTTFVNNGEDRLASCTAVCGNRLQRWRLESRRVPQTAQQQLEGAAPVYERVVKLLEPAGPWIPRLPELLANLRAHKQTLLADHAAHLSVRQMQINCCPAWSSDELVALAIDETPSLRAMLARLGEDLRHLHTRFRLERSMAAAAAAVPAVLSSSSSSSASAPRMPLVLGGGGASAAAAPQRQRTVSSLSSSSSASGGPAGVVETKMDEALPGPTEAAPAVDESKALRRRPRLFLDPTAAAAATRRAEPPVQPKQQPTQKPRALPQRQKQQQQQQQKDVDQDVEMKSVDAGPRALAVVEEEEEEAPPPPRSTRVPMRCLVDNCPQERPGKPDDAVQMIVLHNSGFNFFAGTHEDPEHTCYLVCRKHEPDFLCRRCRDLQFIHAEKGTLLCPRCYPLQTEAAQREPGAKFEAPLE